MWKAVNKEFAGIYQYYVYDDKGERIIKYNLKEGPQLYQNGVLVDGGSIAIDGYKIYPNPYVTVDANNTFTKHYYAGDQRVASRIGDADFTKMKQDSDSQTPDKKDLPDPETDMKIYLEKAGIDMKSLTTELSKNGGSQPNVYYLHGDHLGTATFVTEQNAEATQFFLNLPFGETMAEQMTGVYDNPYKFNAKELDSETGLYYYGARYYNPRLSIWYGVDPLAEKYPSWSPYAYAFNNPINLIDPDGREPIDPRPRLSGISNVTNVLAGRRWIPYMSKTIQRTETSFSFSQGFTRKSYCTTGECADYSRLQVAQGTSGDYTSVGSKSRIDMFVKDGGDTSKLDLQKGINTIVRNLKQGRAVMAGVMYDASKDTGNPNEATNHYITIVGMGTDKQGAYFSYYDNYAGEGHKEQTGESVGTDISINKFRLSQTKDGTYYFSDGADGTIPYNQNKKVEMGNKNKQPARYILTEVRDNK